MQWPENIWVKQMGPVNLLKKWKQLPLTTKKTALQYVICSAKTVRVYEKVTGVCTRELKKRTAQYA